MIPGAPAPISDRAALRALRACGLEPAGWRRDAEDRASARSWRDPDELAELGHRRAAAAPPAP